MLAIATAILVVIASLSLSMFGRKRFDPKGQFCYVPGGSAGLGKALSAELVRRGAHVVIVARDIKRAEETVSELKAIAAPDQKVFAVQADLTSREASERALDTACAAFNKAPDHTFLCAGFSKPQLFVDATSEDLQSGLDGVYWVSAWTAHAAVKMMVKQRVTGSITFVSSFVGYAPFAGYSTYAPGKFALRADALRSEMQLHGIKVHLYMPAGILSPGYENEQKTKPDITKKIEDGDTPISAEAAAGLLIAGIEKGHYQITNDLITDLIRAVSAGAVPGNGVLDFVYGFIASIGVPIWRMMTDSQVRGAKKSVEEKLERQGFFAK